MQFGEVPQLHINIDYAVRPFQAVEDEYLELFSRFSGEEAPRVVYLEDIAEAFDRCTDEWAQFLNTKTGEIVSLPEHPGLTDDKENEALWQEIEETRDYIRLPSQYELHEKDIMENFTATCVSSNRADRLWRALNGRHPYRFFKSAINEMGIAQKYYDFRALTFFYMAEAWCRDNHVRYRRRGSD